MQQVINLDLKNEKHYCLQGETIEAYIMKFMPLLKKQSYMFDEKEDALADIIFFF